MVIPIGDVNPTRRTAWMTWLLIAINVGVFVLFTPWWAGACQQLRFFAEWAVIPAELFQQAPLDAGQLAAANRFGCRVLPIAGKSVYASILYAMFLHGGWTHLLFNMLYLAVFGNNIEDRVGHLGFLGFYLLTGAIATVVFAVANQNSTTTLVGASGAIAGVLGAYLVIFPRARVRVLVPFLLFLLVELPALLVLGLWFVLQLQSLRVGSLAGGGIAYLAHVVGFVAGAAIVVLLGYRPQPPPRRRPVRRVRY